MKAFRIALLGGGTVGGSFYALVQGQKERFLSLGLEVGFTGVLVRDPEKPRAIPRALLKGEPFDLLEAEVVVEAMGGVEAPFRLLLPALEAGIPVQGVCLYPVTDYPAWDDDRHCPTGLLSHPKPGGSREVYGPLAEELRRQQRLLADLEVRV
mgnify:CR=1 FL=1